MKQIKKEEMFENLANVWTALGREPKYDEMVSPLSKIDSKTYQNKFKTWRIALKEFVEYMNDGKIVPIELITPTEVPVLRKTPRSVNLRLRWKIIQRDHMKCVHCGRSPANDNVTLEVDHIVPVSKGGETVEENLQTYCNLCNKGASNLDKVIL